jgi:excisionase family DNA binding protein
MTMDEERGEIIKPPGVTSDPVPFVGRCLRPREAADYLGISRAKLYELVSSGAVESITIGRSRRFPLGALAAYVTERLAAAKRSE